MVMIENWERKANNVVKVAAPANRGKTTGTSVAESVASAVLLNKFMSINISSDTKKRIMAPPIAKDLISTLKSCNIHSPQKRNIISRAKKYLYIFTPYLIIGSEMRTALVNAAKSGVDVRLVVPGIPDKKLVYFLTQSNFPYLIKNGVKIYTYTPGFIHAKCFVSDDIQATVGTVNLDYRSLCLHFECGVWMYRTRAVLQVKEDALKTFAESHEVTLEEFQKKSFLVRTFMGALKLFAPLL